MKKATVILCLMLCATVVMAQLRIDGYNNPWCGGLNACQFGQVDLNGDGKDDLVVFDRHGSRLLTFLNDGDTGEVRYTYRPEYQPYFPHIDDWLIMADYDNDGHNDIFTFSKGWAGIKVFRNTGETPPNFELVKSPYLTSFQNGGEVNILATNADYPAIIDLDGDGDLDILTFQVLGTFIEKHQNMSMELYGTADSLVFEKMESCWGHIAESEENNAMYLDTCLFGMSFYVTDDILRHRGATFAVRDLNGDGLLDLLLGDVDYPTLTLLKNGGSTQTAVMVSQTDVFPENSPIHLFSMPLPFFGDINNDGLCDMLVSPFDPNGMSCEGINSIWLYINTGTNSNPVFELVTKSFLQNEMIDVGTGSYPAFCDINNDGRKDLIIGSLGDISATSYPYGSLEAQRTAHITAYTNTGNVAEPVLQLTDKDLGMLSELKTSYLTPTSAVIDNETFFLFGSADGGLILADNEYNVIDTNFLDFGMPYSSPCLFDVNGDNIIDLVIGHKDGKLSFYKGSTNETGTSFELVSHYWGGVDVRDYNTSFFGYSTPCLFNHQGETYLLVGSEQGKLFLYDNLSDDAEGVFNDVSHLLDEWFDDFSNSFGMMSAPAADDIDNDGKIELVVGNFGGGLQLFNSDIQVFHSVTTHTASNISLWPNPAKDVIHLRCTDKGLSVSITDLTGHVVFTQNNNNDLDISNLAQGIYLVTILCDDTVTTQKIIKM